MWWWALTPTVDDMSLPDRMSPLTDVGAAGRSVAHGDRKLIMLVFVFFFCQDRSAVCICCQPEPELSGEEHTATGQQQHEGPTHLCKRHADGETKTLYSIECVAGASSLCFVSSTLCCQYKRQHCLLSQSPKWLSNPIPWISSWFVDDVNNLSRWGKRTIFLLVVLVTVTNVLLKTCTRETGDPTKYFFVTQSIFTPVFVFHFGK